MTKGGHPNRKRRPARRRFELFEPLERRAMLAAGAIDTSFGASGFVKTGIGPATAMTLQPDGKILVAGGGGTDFVVARYNADGSLDSTFGTAGTAVKDMGGSDTALAIARQADGKILVGGGSGTNFALLRLTAAGAPDPTFGAGGVVITPTPGTSGFDREIRALALAPGGKIVAAGGNGGAMVVARYNANGTLDNTFDGDGIAVTAFTGYLQARANGVAVQSDGRIVVGGFGFKPVHYDFTLARYNANGVLDSSFGTGGRVITDVGVVEGFGGSGIGNALILQGDGKILLGGKMSDNRFGVARYTTAGTLDPTFAGNGITSLTIGPLTGTDTHAANAMAIGQGGRIIVAGRAANLSPARDDFALVRFHDDGAPDYSFGLDGTTNRTAAVLTNLGSQNKEQINALAIQSDGKILAAGVTNTTFSGTGGSIGMVRYDGAAEPNVLPVADANPFGPYTVGEGGRALIVAGATDADGKVVKYEWDWDYDGFTFTPDYVGQFDYFNAASLDGPSTRTIAVQVTDDRGGQSVQPTTVTITDTPPALSASGPRSVTIGTPYRLTLAAPDPGFDTITSLTVDWGDEHVESFNWFPGSLEHMYTRPGRYQVKVTASDEDGTYAANTGMQDATFATNGVRVLEDMSPAPNEQDVVLATRPLPDGSVLMVGAIAGERPYLAKLTPEGSFDSSFGNFGGYTLFRFGTASDPNAQSDDLPYAIEVLRDGTILVAGSTVFGNGNADWALAAFDSRGQLDPSFGTNGSGKVVLNFGGGSVSDEPRAIVALPDGRFYVGGFSSGNFALARFTRGGALDATFDTDGKQTTDMGGTGDSINSLALTRGGNVVSAGRGTLSGKNVMAVARYTPAGALDASFDTDGKLLHTLATNGSLANGVTVTPDDRIVLAGAAFVTNLGDLAVVRLMPDGSPDVSFGTNGAWIRRPFTPFEETDMLRGLRVLSDGSVLAGGMAGLNGVTHFALVKLTPAGAPDPAFGQGGIHLLAVSNAPSSATFGSTFSYGGGRAFIAGWSAEGAGGARSTIARFGVTAPLAVVTPSQPSVVTSALVLGGPALGPGPALRFTFDNDVESSLEAGDLEIQNADSGATIDTSGLVLEYDADSFQATFSGVSLPNGNYRATIRANDVTDAAGNAMTADHVYDFFILSGDANRDRKVDFADLVVVAQNYNGGAGKTYEQGDFNFDGVVDFSDLVALAQRYGTVLAPPAAPLAARFAEESVLMAESPSSKPVFSRTPVAKPTATKNSPHRPLSRWRK